MHSPAMIGSRSRIRWVFAVITVSIGLAVFLLGVQLEIQNPKPDDEGNVAWCVLGVGTSLLAAGVSLPFVRQYTVIVIALISPFVAFALASVTAWGFWLGYVSFIHRSHLEFAANCTTQIEPVRQMDRIYADCRHYLTYGPNGDPLVNSVAYFGERYELTMQVPVEIESDSSGTMIGEPQFHLNEISTVTISASGRIRASFSRSLNIESEKWQQVYDVDGDYTAIGLTLNPDPVVDFQTYTTAGRASE